MLNSGLIFDDLESSAGGNMFRKLISMFKRSEPQGSSFNERKQSMSIDVSGPDFYDFYPTRFDFYSSISRISALKPEAHDWIASLITQKIRGGSSYDGALKEVLRSGEPLAGNRVKALGLNARRKVGQRFADATIEGGAKDAIDALTEAIQVTVSKTRQLYDLRRTEEAGISHCRLLSPRDERSTPLERELDGKRVTVAEARELVLARAVEIKRSSFIGDVKW